MVPVLKFMSINEPRVIIKNGDMPISVYFILNGEVEMKKNTNNKVSFKNNKGKLNLHNPFMVRQ